MTTRIQTFGGNIGIGTDDPGSFKLNVVGGVKAQSLVVNGVTNSQTPIGLLGLWYGTVELIPAGWHICDGTTGITKSDGNGTIDVPDLRERFIRGASTTPQVGQFGGNNTVTLSAANLPPHTHTFTSDDGGLSHQHPINDKQTLHSHGENVAQATAPHNHGTSDAANMNHNHIVDTTDVLHAHNNPAPEGNANASHNHGIVPLSWAAHSHSIINRYATPGSSRFPGSRVRVHAPTDTMETGANNMSHEHEGYQAANAPHTHVCEPTQVPHNHDTGNEQAPHDHGNSGVGNSLHGHSIQTESLVTHLHQSLANTSAAHTHTGTTASTGQETVIGIQNPYYLLAYIMKI